MSRCQRVVQSILACGFTCALLLAFAMPGTVAHAASSVSIGTSSCLAPPANFNPLMATKSQVALYGLPPKPAKQQDLQRWAKRVNSAKHRSCGAPIPRANHYSQPVPVRATGAAGASGVTPNFSNSSWTTWSGYATGWGYGSGFDEAYGEWNLPCVYTPDPYGYHSITWVGLGGWYNQPNQNLLQAGTINDPTWGRSLWWEAWPSNFIQIIPGISPNCGDKIFSDVWVNYNPSISHYWVQDISQNVYYSGQYNNFVPNIQSAEWIDERPTCANGQYSPLANFRNTNFSDAHAEVTGTSTYGTISSYRPGSITMVDPSYGTIAAPGGLNSAGDSFTDYWNGTGAGSLC